ncbi:MAG: UDP-glucose 4-epimerase GalE [Rhodospirillales bacterium]|nr:UDP-glucose 4-epimerase GalE [Rhodospirillales bacterium]
MSTKPNILVTGGAGYIGSHAVLAFSDAGYSVVVIDNLSTGHRESVPSFVPLVEGDVADTALVGKVLVDHNIGAVIHFAGSIVVPESVSDPLKYYGNNTSASRNLIEACVRAGVPHFVFSSTAAVYGIPETIPVSEQTPTQPINPYGASKLMTEWTLRDVANAHDFSYAALRYFNVAGADPSGRTGQSTPLATHLIKVACEAAIGKRSHIQVFGEDYDTPDGTCIRDYIHVSDLAAAHVFALEHLIATDNSFIANCGYGHGYSVREVLKQVESVSGRHLDVRSAPRRPGDPEALVADPSRILATLPWRPEYDDLRFIVQTALEWERKVSANKELMTA